MWKKMNSDEIEPYKAMGKDARKENTDLRAKGLLIEKTKTKDKKQKV